MSPAQLFQEALRLHQAGRIAEAEQTYRRVIEIDPQHVDATINLGAALDGLGRSDEAIEVYRVAERLAPANWLVHFNLGHAYYRAARFDAAAAAFQRALPNCPRRGAALHGLGAALLNAGRLEEARQRLKEAVNLSGDDVALWVQYGLTLAKLGELDAALEWARRAVALQTSSFHARNLLGAVLRSLERDGEAEPHLREAVRLNPGFGPALNNFGLMLMDAGQSAESVEYLRRSLAAGPIVPDDHSNYLLAFNYSSRLSPREMLAEHRRWAEQHADRLAPASPPPAVSHADGRLRIGYLSADFRTHPVASFIAPVLPQHDRGAFHVTAYASVRAPDSMTARLQGYVDQWHPVFNVSDDDVAKLVRDDAIDILVDLGGHTNGNRLLVFARQPAPIQATMFGYPNTTGLRTMHYRVSDTIADEPGVSDAWYTERLIRLPEIAWCYDPPGEAPPVCPPPVTRSGRFTFGSVNNLAKVGDEVIAALSKILHAAPGSRLILLMSRTGLAQARVEALLRQSGLAPDRVELIPRLSRSDYFNLFNRIDLALDPFPYNGGVTTCDSLWMGVPVVTLAGTTYRARQGLCLLTHAGLPQFIASSLDDYVRIAQETAREPGSLNEIRVGLRERLRQSPIMQAKRYTAHLENAYRQMWAECHGSS
jgi:predicted O-linked N-acetylglucosamine transferase (SPINDLY family)